MIVLKVYGKDYSLLEETKFEIDGNDVRNLETENGDIELTREVKEKIIKSVLDESECKIIDKNSVDGRNEKKPIYEDFNGLRFGGFVGVLSMPLLIEKEDNDGELKITPNSGNDNFTLILQIQSRFDTNSHKPFFLTTMLMQMSDLKPSSNVVPSSDDDFFDFLLIIRFKYALQNACLKGFFHTYHTFENNDDHIRGTIDIARHIKENLGLNNGRIAYRYREKTVDNYLNHLIVAAYYCFKKKHPDWARQFIDNDFEIKRILDILKNTIGYPKYNLMTIISKNLSRISHPYYEEYEMMRTISLQILRDEGISPFDGNLDFTEGLLFYIPDLFEEFLNKLFKKHGICFEEQCRNRIFSYETEPKKFLQDIRPDFAFFNDDKPFMILDAKFKPEWGNRMDSEKSLKSNNLLADYDKCIRDMNAFGCHATGTVFPTNINSIDIERHGISKDNQIDVFYTVPLLIPDNQGEYNEWEKEFDKNCENIITKLKDKLELEKSYFSRIASYIESIKEERNK